MSAGPGSVTRHADHFHLRARVARTAPHCGSQAGNRDRPEVFTRVDQLAEARLRFLILIKIAVTAPTVGTGMGAVEVVVVEVEREAGGAEVDFSPLARRTYIRFRRHE